MDHKYSYFSKYAKRLLVSFGVFLCIFSLTYKDVLFAISPEDIQRIINNTVFYSEEACEEGVVGTGNLEGRDNKEKIFNYLVGKNVAGRPLQDFHVAGILGNMKSESGFEPQRAQGIFDRLVPPQNWEEAIGGGYGLVQWTPGSKMVDPVTNAARAANISQPELHAGELQPQLDFLLEQLNGGTPSPEGAAGEDLIAQTDVAGATFSFEMKYERHRPPAQPHRIVDAEDILREMRNRPSQPTTATGTTTPSPQTDDQGSDGPLDTRPVIVLDPGHDGETTNHVDPQTGLNNGTLANPTERVQVWQIAMQVKSELEQAGYTVITTKDREDDIVYHRNRANIANEANAALAVSIHTDGNHRFGEWQEIYTQKNGLYRGSGSEKLTFNNSELEAKSMEYAQAMKIQRDAIEVTSGTTVIKDNSFNGRGGTIEPGNIPFVMLYATVPWIYLEAGGNNDTTGLTEQQRSTYAEAIVAGIKEAIPPPGPDAANCDGESSAGNGDVVATALEYAWPQYFPRPYTQMKPAYADAVREAQAQGLYVGGIDFPGVDCGGFVTRVMLDSGYEPRYNSDGRGGPTGSQLDWLEANWENLGPGSDSIQLQPGDVAIRDGHTYMYVGQQPDFETQIASASLDNRAPMAGRETTNDPEYTWYRKR